MNVMKVVIGEIDDDSSKAKVRDREYVCESNSDWI